MKAEVRRSKTHKLVEHADSTAIILPIVYIISWYRGMT